MRKANTVNIQNTKKKNTTNKQNDVTKVNTIFTPTSIYRNSVWSLLFVFHFRDFSACVQYNRKFNETIKRCNNLNADHSTRTAKIQKPHHSYCFMKKSLTYIFLLFFLRCLLLFLYSIR